MKTPDAALLRARAKAPLPHLHALHLSGADLASLRNLEPCCRLRSLYANANVLKDIDGLTSLRCLWRIDLSDNRMRQLTALASFPALGFLQLERNQLGFEDLVWLRDVHILDLRLIGNSALLAAGADRVATIEYRMKVVALLPLVWTLDGHYISTSERAQAVEAYDDWVLPLLASHSDGALRFGSTCDLWGGVVSGLNPEDLTTPVQQDVLQLLEAIEKQPTRHPDKQDLYRLGTLAAFYDRERDVHNAHAQFAPQRHAPTAKLMPSIRLHQLQTLSPRARLETAVLLATHVAFPLPTKLLTEALTISILSDGDSDSGSVAWAQDLVSLPVYGVVAVVSTLRFQAMAEYGENCSPSSTDPSDPIQIWTAMPVVLLTLLQSERHIQLVERSTPDPYYRQRCALAVSLLARASTFPSKPPPNVYDLVATAKLASMHTLTHLRFAIPTVLVGDSSSSAMSWKKLHPNQPDRDYRKPWSERAHLTESVSSPDVRSPITRHKRRRPKTSEWLEVQPKLFLKIRSVSADGEMLTVSPGTSNDISHATITIYMDQITYVSCSMWRLVDDDPHTLEEIRNVLSQKPSAMKSRLGKLHRDAEGFHKHGAFRNQGYPNHTVSTEDLQTIPFGDDERVTVRAMQAQPIEVFSSTDTLDANYVLTSPALINVQNAVASRAFYNRRQAPAGLWNPIETASFRVTHSMDAVTPVQVEATLMASKVKKIKSKKGCHPQQPHDEWRELQEDMQALLGIRFSAADSVDATCFMTSVPAERGLEGRCFDSTRSSNGSEILCATSPASMLNDEPSPVCVSTISAPRSSAKPRKLAALPWHQVSTKPQLLVAAASPLAPKRKDTGKTAATAGHVSVTELDAAVASMARSSSSASTARLASLRLTFEGSLPNKHAKHAKHHIPFTPVVADTMTATMPMTLDAPTFDSIPRLRWSDADHRFHFNMPFAAEPGDDGFVLLQQIDDSDSLNAMSLPPSERQHIKEMERFNAMIKEVENSAHLRDTVKYLERQRAHSDEFHERVVTEDDLKPRVVKKKSFNRGKTSPKQAFNQLRQKPTRMGRVQQPK